ncbi:MAG TPA: TonB-dependent receptor [Rhizomicrobium sp.]|jgi:outer membrane receptor protein involved in Fe transport
MPAKRTVLSGRSGTLIGALLLSTALAAPAFAQEGNGEIVVVTAQKKAENIQQVPIAVSAFSGADLAAHQIQGFADLQFSIPSVSFTHGNFGPSNFTIRGIGSAAVSTSGDSGVSVNLNQVYLNAPPLTSATYYDLDNRLGIQVLRGPQSTLWGRNATGGAIDVETAKPELGAFAADAEGTYGNYNDQELRGMVNLPVGDTAALRISGFWENRDGTVKNIYPGLNPGSGIVNRVDGRNDYSFRGSFRWQPTDRTTVDFMLQTSHESDSRVRGQVQECDRDPSGILGCLPDKLGFQATNGNATLGTELASTYFFGNLSPLLTPLGLFDITGPGALPGQGANQIVPHSLREVNTPFSPTSEGKDLFASVHWHQDVASWLTMDATFGYDNNSGRSQESYNNSPGDNLNTPATCTQLFVITGGADSTCTQIPGVSRLVAAQEFLGAIAPTNFGTYYAGHLGTLPTTKILGPNNTGIANLNGLGAYNNTVYGYDQIDGRDNEWSGEVRFASNLDGPVNFNLGFYHNHDRNDAHYYVNADTLDYAGVALGAAEADGTVAWPSQYDNNNNSYTLLSNSIFGEVYFDAIPDVLKFTVGARYSDDKKAFQSGQVLFNGESTDGSNIIPIGQQSFNYISLPNGESCAPPSSTHPASFNPDNLPCFSNQSTTFREWTGRGVVDWTPTISWSDATHIYASYSRGVRDGGFNPPPLNPGDFPLTFAPETLDAFEVGDKNTFLGGALQANITGWYYKYSGYQTSEIVDRTSINQNINSRLWGVEGELFWAATDKLQFNANFGYTHSAIDSQLDVDPRNPLGNNTSANSLLVKDASNGSMCVINGPSPLSNPGLVAAFDLTAPPTPTVINGHVATTAFGFGACTANGEAAINLGLIPGATTGYTATQGNPVNLKGNEMPLTPPWTVSVGVQYTFDIGGGYTLIPRADYYWTDSQWARIFEDGADRIRSYDVANAQISLNAPDSSWYARAWVKNVFDKDNMTGEYLTDASSGLFTNAFVGEPRTYGLTLGVHL